jgi:hypothetical protein
MEFVEFTPENCTPEKNTGKDRPATIRVNQSGLFSLNKKAMERLELKKGSGVTFLRAKEEADCWYLRKAKLGEPAFPIAEQKNGTFTFCNTKLAKLMAEGIHGQGFKGKFTVLIAGQPTEAKGGKFYGLLARPLA